MTTEPIRQWQEGQGQTEGREKGQEQGREEAAAEAEMEQQLRQVISELEDFAQESRRFLRDQAIEFISMYPKEMYASLIVLHDESESATARDKHNNANDVTITISDKEATMMVPATVADKLPERKKNPRENNQLIANPSKKRNRPCCYSLKNLR